MNNEDKQPGRAGELRRQAEEITREQAVQSSEALSPEETRQMLHELQVHQVELELQNEELRRSEAELNTSRARYFDLYDEAPVGYLTLNEKGFILEANLSAAAMLGVMRGKLSNRPLSGFIIKEDKDVYYRHRKALLGSEKPQMCELRLVKSDGSQFWAHLESSAGQDNAAMPVYRVVLSDITERRRQEELLHDSHRRLESIIEGTHAGTWEWNVQTGEAVFNEIWAQMIGYTLDELAPMSIKTWQEFAHPDDLTQSTLLLERHFAGEVPYYDCECRIKHRDGHWVWVHDRGRVINRTDDGKPLMMFGTHTDITERKQAEDRVHESEEKYRSVFTAESDALFLVDRETGAILDVNEAASDLYGYTREELLQLRAIDTSAEPEETKQIMQESKNRIETRLHKKKDGTVFPVDISASFFTLNDREVILGAARDITERKTVERRQYLFGEIMSILNDSPALADALNSVLAVIKREKGFDALGIRLKDSGDYPYVVQNGFPNEFLLAENMLASRDHDGECRRDDNGNYSLECTCGLVILGQTDPANPDFSPGGSFWTNDATPLLDLPATEDPRVNPRNRCIHEGFSSVALIPIRAQQEIVGLLQFNSRKKNCFTPDMIRFFEGISASIGIAVMRKQAEDALNMAHKELEQRVDERTKDLQSAHGRLLAETEERQRVEEQLVRVQKLEALGTLAGGIAHDFNNILAGIIGFTEMVREDIAADTPAHRKLELVLKGANRGRDLVKQILAFSRQAGQDKKPLELHRIVEEGLKLLRPTLPSTIEIVLKNATDDAVIHADPTQMHQILMNLSTNAAHAMREKGGRLDIGISQVALTEGDSTPFPDLVAGEYVVLEVRDTGCGMEPKTLEKIFDPFFTTKEQGEGTGLGLSVTHGIVMAHNGHIAVESEPGKGTVFRVYLPKIKEQKPSGDSGAGPVIGGKERILIVDDEDIIIELDTQRLSRLGYDVVATTSSVEALDIFRRGSRRFDLVITDHVMPILTGMDLAEKLRKVRPDIPIILSTGYSDTISPEQTKKRGISEFLMKPITKRQLAEAVRRVLDTGKAK